MKNIPFYFSLLPIVFALLVGGVFIVGFSGTLSIYSTLLLAWCITNWLLSMEYKGDIEYEESDELRKALEMINTKYKLIEKQVHKLESLKEYKSYLEELIHTDPTPFESYIKNK